MYKVGNILDTFSVSNDIIYPIIQYICEYEYRCYQVLIICKT